MDENINELKKKYEQIRQRIDPDAKRQEIKHLEARTYDTDFWNDHETAVDVMKRINEMKKEIEDVDMMQLLLEENQIDDARELINEYEIRLFLSGAYDQNDAIFAIHAGQGGTEAMDWSDMLRRMYTRFFERRGWKYEEVDRVAGEEAGIKSIIIKIYGQFAFGYLKAEAGVHRLVRQSPFNADGLRQTSFALVEVYPIIKNQQIDIREEDLEWQFFRSGGHGGQNVNKVSTAVRLTHKPSGLVVTCQQERSQLQNRENALTILRGQLWKLEEEKKKNEIDAFKTDKMASWGRQIRSYVLHPYKMIKDLRTDYEESQTDRVLDGEIDGFLEAYLRKNT